jgi:hypothetical protein
MEFQVPNCPRCNTPLVKIKDKDYYGCPNWKPNGQGCEGTIWWPEGKRKRDYPMKFASTRIESKSNPGHFHTVILYESGDMDCPCYAGNLSKFCDHKIKMVKKMDELSKKIKEKHKDKFQ